MAKKRGGKYNALAVDTAINSAYRGKKKKPSRKQRSVVHALLKGRS